MAACSKGSLCERMGVYEHHLGNLYLGKLLSFQFPALSKGAVTLLSLQILNASHHVEFDPEQVLATGSTHLDPR